METNSWLNVSKQLFGFFGYKVFFCNSVTVISEKRKLLPKVMFELLKAVLKATKSGGSTFRKHLGKSLRLRYILHTDGWYSKSSGLEQVHGMKKLLPISSTMIMRRGAKGFWKLRGAPCCAEDKLFTTKCFLSSIQVIEEKNK